MVPFYEQMTLLVVTLFKRVIAPIAISFFFFILFRGKLLGIILPDLGLRVRSRVAIAGAHVNNEQLNYTRRLKQRKKLTFGQNVVVQASGIIPVSLF